MRKNRYFPFGYTMENGAIVARKEESKTVLEIFQWYLAGGSYLSIARKLTDGTVPYHPHTNLWNKHMIKRMLEDGRYLGGEYPPLIDSVTFKRVRDMVESKALKPTKPYTRRAKTEFVCGECGKGLDISRFKKKELSCANIDCILHGKLINESFFSKSKDHSLLEKQLTAVKIQQKAELAQPNPCENTLIHLAEELASLRFSQLASTDPETQYIWEDLPQVKRVIVYQNRIQIITDRS